MPEHVVIDSAPIDWEARALAFEDEANALREENVGLRALLDAREAAL